MFYLMLALYWRTFKRRSHKDFNFQIPPHSRIRQNMTDVSGGSGGFIFSDLKFTTGFLAEVAHQL